MSGTLVVKCMISFTVHSNTRREGGTPIIPMLEIRKLRIQEVTQQELKLQSMQRRHSQLRCAKTNIPLGIPSMSLVKTLKFSISQIFLYKIRAEKKVNTELFYSRQLCE